MRITLLLILFLIPYLLSAKQHIATPYSERVYVTQTTKEFISELNKELSLDIVFHGGESLYKHNEIYRAVRTNQIQFGEIFIAQLSNHAAIFQLDNLPFIASSFSDAKQLWQVQQQELKTRLAKDGLHLLFANPWPTQGLFTQKAITSSEQLAGLKVRSYSAITAKLADHLEMIPTSVSSAEIAQAFAAGMIEAMITSPATGVSSRAWQFSHYYTPINAWIPKNMVIMNRQVYSSLSQQDKNKLKAIATAFQKLAWQRAEQQTTLMTNQLQQQGIQISPVTQQLTQALNSVGNKMAEEWQANASDSEKLTFKRYLEAKHVQPN
ncbi:TRAP transporter substrate-binding protein [Pseudoalteromonas sp.]|uniref:TRAP transporter substrate-binding protein n=1 Tax=Pseudoalteromonas sp. TaxID=53249 RepID=UPI0035683217